MDSVFSYIESDTYAAELSIANTVNTLHAIVSGNSEIMKLQYNAIADPNTAAQLYKRIEMLIQTETDTNYLHRYDYAISTYLMLLKRSSAVILDKALYLIFEHHEDAPNLWWTYKLYNIYASNSKLEKTDILISNTSAADACEQTYIVVKTNTSSRKEKANADIKVTSANW